ncbi:MAG: universal stress protein [Thermodesulfobacteriota bacterium]
MINQILVAVDGSPFSLRAARLGAKILHPNPAGTLILLYIAKPETDLDWFQGPGGNIQEAPEKERRALETALAKGQHILKEAVGALQDLMTGETFQIENLVVPGDPAQKIIETAEKRQAELIIIGRRGVGSIRRTFLGSISRKVLDQSQCPVLVVK